MKRTHLSFAIGFVICSHFTEESVNGQCELETLFSKSSSYPTGEKPIAIAISDFDMDGISDVATANLDSDDIGVLLGIGDGSFGPVVVYPLAGSGATALAIEDLNGDSVPDIVAASLEGLGVSILLGAGDGTFVAGDSYVAGDRARELCTGDLNNDNMPDLVVANFDSNDLSVFLGDGTGSFSPAVSYDVEFGPRSVAMADLNDDGNRDVAVANYYSGSISVLLGNGDGTLLPHSTYPSHNVATDVAVLDFNSDGVPDLAVADYTMRIFLGVGDGTFLPHMGAPSGDLEARRISTGDLNGDEFVELVTFDSAQSNPKVGILPGSSDASLIGLHTFELNSAAGDVEIADIDGDQVHDLVFATWGQDKITVLLNECKPPDLVENFTDDELDTSLWCVYENFPEVISTDEINLRLEVTSPGNDGVEAAAFIYNCGWELDTTRDFRWKVELHFELPGPVEGEVGIQAICWFAGDPASGGGSDFTAVLGTVGFDGWETYLGTELVVQGSHVSPDDFIFFAWPVERTFYFSYHADEDMLTVSTDGYDDLEAAEFLGLRAASGDTTAGVILGGFSDGVAPPLLGAKSWLDALLVESGVVFECPVDVSDDHHVGSADLAQVLGTWGPCGRTCPTDLNGDGVVGPADLAIVLGNWGPCELN